MTVSAALTIAGNFTDRTQHSWAGASGMTISAASTITSNGKTWPNAVAFSNANTKTLVGNWTISGVLTISTSATVINKTTAETLSCAGVTATGTSSGTITVILTGGTWQTNSALTWTGLQFAGNVTISGGVSYNGGTLTYTSGTITTTSSTLTISASTTMSTNGMSWANITIATTGFTLTINSLLTVTGTLTINATIAATFAGTAGFLVGTFTSLAIDARTYTFANTVTYTITTSLKFDKSPPGLTVTSDHATNLAIIVLSWGALCNVAAAFTRIDATGGRPILTHNGVLTTTTNIVSYGDIGMPPPMFVRRFGRGNTLYNRAIATVYQPPRN